MLKGFPDVFLTKSSPVPEIPEVMEQGHFLEAGVQPPHQRKVEIKKDPGRSRTAHWPGLSAKSFQRDFLRGMYA